MSAREGRLAVHGTKRVRTQRWATLCLVALPILAAGTVRAQSAQAQSPSPQSAQPQSSQPQSSPRPQELEPGVSTSALEPDPGEPSPAAPASAPPTVPPAPAGTSAASAPAPASPTRSRTPPKAAGPGKAQDRIELDTTQITGNRELPKVLVIVPWKRAELGDLLGKPVNSLVDEVLQPIDRDVFRRQNRYYRALQPDAAGGKPGGTGAEAPH